MRDHSGPAWTDHTINAWIDAAGSTGALVHRAVSEGTWSKPLAWNRSAYLHYTPIKVRTATLSELFGDGPGLTRLRRRLFELIEATPWLVWQFVTDRPQNIADMVPWGDTWPPNVWIGTTVTNQGDLWPRVDPLLCLPGPAVRFLVCRPAGPLDVRNIAAGDKAIVDALSGDVRSPTNADAHASYPAALDWLIVSGQTGRDAVAMLPSTLRDLRDQANDTNTPLFFTGWGRWEPLRPAGQLRAGHVIDGRVHQQYPPIARPTASGAVEHRYRYAQQPTT